MRLIQSSHVLALLLHKYPYVIRVSIFHGIKFLECEFSPKH